MTPPRSPLDARTLLLVHNTGGGMFGGVRAAWSRLRHPDASGCALCSLTRGVFGANPRWESFLASRPEQVLEVTRDRFRADHPASSWRTVELPAILVQDGPRLDAVLTAREIRHAASVPELITALDHALGESAA